MRYSKMVALAAAGVLALGMSGCGTSPAGSTEKADSTPLAEAPVELTQASFVEELSGAQSAARTAHFSMTYSGAGAEAAGLAGAPMEADVDLSDPENPAMAMQMTIEGETTDMVVVDGELYLAMGEMTSGKYLSMTEAGKSDHPMAALFAGMGEIVRPSMEDMDPTAQLNGMEGAITSFEKTGTETVDGVETDVYTLVVDPAKATGPQTEGIPEKELAKLGDMEVIYNVDGENLPHKMVTKLGAGNQEIVVTGIFSRWGESVDVVAPTGDQLIGIDELMEGMPG
ncbi:hypothetical protein C8K30_111228 [Promicromonospora sp. AC04]|uniref:hypothetical protein n=1 Tax=Promicromonospora sp. AC04 TaxID=2135723 RepID=UPI000D415885|nr:hypothetical protein [Promicromonospora sp. AC04]PUB23630.1 hypothetical protein C8K30_111228 [Promicromonospora sp. AC04]